MFIVTPIVGVCSCSVFFLYVALCPFWVCSHLGGEEGTGCVAWFVFLCLVVVVWLFLAVPWICLRFVIVVFPDPTHLLFL